MGLGLSRRYVNDLLADSGSSFAERVLEMRLQKARTMLMDAGFDRLKVSKFCISHSNHWEVKYRKKTKSTFLCSAKSGEQTNILF